MNATAAQLHQDLAARLVAALEAALTVAPPHGVDRAYLAGYFARNRAALVAVARDELGGAPTRPAAPSRAVRARVSVADEQARSELYTKATRTRANLDAMRIAARLGGRAPTADELRALALYSGWGGLSIAENTARFPAGFPVPEARGLIHEYYTPARVTRAVAAAVSARLDTLPTDEDGVVHALEPSAGIGRFLAAFERVSDLFWHAVEYSALSSRMLAVLFPEADLFAGPFERWIREHGAHWAGKLGLVVANPPFGTRGPAITEDPDRSYREAKAYRYFLRRGLDLLAEGGLGVYLIPAGFLGGRSEGMKHLRALVLRRHHLAAAFRLPSHTADGRNVFPGAKQVTDVLFFRARGGELDDLARADGAILEGRYFEAFPEHLLGEEDGLVGDDEDQPRVTDWNYKVVGDFDALPDFEERPVCQTCTITPFEGPKAARAGLVRDTAETADLAPDLALAAALGHRVDSYLALVATETPDTPQELWGELHQALVDWADRYGNPHTHAELRAARSSSFGLERFLTAFDRTGQLLAGLRQPPPPPEVRYRGHKDDVAAQAALLYREQRQLTTRELVAFHRSLGGTLPDAAVVLRALEAGWCLDGPGSQELVPAEVYYTGDLWARYDRVRGRAAMAGEGSSRNLSDPGVAAVWKATGETSWIPLDVAKRQAAKLLELIRPALIDDIEGISPRQGWVPLVLIEGWLNQLQADKGYDYRLSLVRQDGMVTLPDVERYDELEASTDGLHWDVLLILGWINHDFGLFRPDKDDIKVEGKLDDRRLEIAKVWEQAFRAWILQDPARVKRIEDAYNRQFRGYVMPTYTTEPLSIARWTKDGPRLKPHQVAGARRVLAQRGGLLAFDVGVGKTFTGIAILARARQEGWVKRPVVLVPNSIVWQWKKQIAAVLPDYRVVVIGSQMKTISRGPRKGQITSETDTPAERGEKWTRFQAGEYDVALVTYSVFGRTRMNEDMVREYASTLESVRREVVLKQRRLRKKNKKDLTERELAILAEGVAAWVAEKMELPEDHEYDPGVAWDDLGVDLLIVDEAQNYKNLYLPEAREHGVPKFMGNEGDGSGRAWQLDFRAAAVRRRTGGTGIVLLSATPAKNSPLEFYNLIQYIDPRAWQKLGIYQPEQFIDRYLRLEKRHVVAGKLNVEEVLAVTGFLNLHELRDTIHRYGEFKTAEEVGLKLPTPTVEMVHVDLSLAQERKYASYVEEMTEALRGGAGKTAILGLLARLAQVALHPDLDDAYFDWNNADQVPDPTSPKFDALAERVLQNRTCGHIVFVDHLLAQALVARTLMARGIPRERIAFLNGKVAKAAADRQRIAEEFNGDKARGIKPKYDVVIANQVAYEGVDLQARTCAIHHLDLPWEPATLQQRNGRGVRQGNELAAIAIYYYFARRSQDGHRFNLISGKRTWLVELLQSQDRQTNNPGAQQDLSSDEVLLLISRNPEETQKKLDEIRAKRQEEANARLALEAVRLVRAANLRFRKAERTQDGIEAARLRAEGEERLAAAQAIPAEAWPYGPWATVVRDRPVVFYGISPLYEGLRLGLASATGGSASYLEFGRVAGGERVGIGQRQSGRAQWGFWDLKADDGQKSYPVSAYGVPWPPEDEPETAASIERYARSADLLYRPWSALGWHLAPDAWTERTWARFAPLLLERLAMQDRTQELKQRIPVRLDGGIRIVSAITRPGPADVFPPTEEGWRRFLEAAPASGLTWSALAEAADYWWSRTLPRNALRAAEGEPEAAGGTP